MVSLTMIDKTKEANLKQHWQEFFHPHGHLTDRFTQKLPSFLQALDDLPTAGDALLRSKLLISPQKLQRTNNEEKNQLRCIQVQASVRIVLWAIAGATFSAPFARVIRQRNNRKKKRSKRRTPASCTTEDPESVVLEELISILQLAAFLLGPETSFASFLAQCISRQSFEARPILLGRVFQHFECTNPYVEQVPVPLRPLQRPSRPRQPAKQLDQPQKPMKKKDTSSSRKENNAPLTAPIGRRNSLLQGKTRYVGSHFNHHQSVTSLFRHGALKTKATVKPPPSRGTKRVLVPATPCRPKQQRAGVKKAAAAPAMGSLVAQAFQSIDQGNRRRRRK